MSRFANLLALVLLGVTALAMARPGPPLRSLPIWPTLYIQQDDPPPGVLDENVYVESWEDGAQGWTLNQGTLTHWVVDDWEPFSGQHAWRCYSPEYGDPGFGGYGNEWTELLITPPLPVQGATAASSSFQFRLSSEATWDAAAVFVLHGNDPDSLTLEHATVSGTAYNDPSPWAFELLFGEPIPGWSGTTEPFSNSYQPATVDLAPYVGSDVVQVVLLFASDTAYNSDNDPQMFGFQVDEWTVTADDSVVWANDADDTIIGDPPEASSSLPGDVILPDGLVYVFEDDTAPSGTFVAGVTSDLQGYVAYWEGPEFSLPELNPGEELFVDLSYSTQWDYDNDWPLVEQVYFRIEPYDPDSGEWGYLTGDIDPVSVISQPTYGLWHRFSNFYPGSWSLTELAGVDGVRLRLELHNPPIDRDFEFFKMDSLTVYRDDTINDVRTVLHVFYPTTVDEVARGEVTFKNIGDTGALGLQGLWRENGNYHPTNPPGPFTLAPGDSATTWLDLPDDAWDQAWVPVAPQANLVLDATHTWGEDEISDNDVFPVVVDYQPAGRFEVGMDSRHYTGELSVPLINTGPVVHIDPTMANPDAFPADWSYDVKELHFRGYFWDADGSTGGAAENAHMGFRVYAGGDQPGALLWEGLHGFNVPVGYTGVVDATRNTGDSEALRGLSGDIWVQAIINDYDQNEVYAQPLPARTGVSPFQSHQFMTLDDAQSGSYLPDFGHHISVVLRDAAPASHVFTLTPVNTTIPAAGGVLSYDLALQTVNPNPVPGLVYWTRATLPNGNTVTVSSFPFDGWAFMDIALSGLEVTVPGAAPAGSYTFTGNVGFPPPSPYRLTDSFPFEKLVPAGQEDTGGPGGSAWSHRPVVFAPQSSTQAAGDAVLPDGFRLSAPSPNPFNPTARVTVDLPSPGELRVIVVNVAGRTLATLADGEVAAGRHQFTLDGHDWASGVVFVRAEVAGEVQVCKAVLLK